MSQAFEEICTKLPFVDAKCGQAVLSGFRDNEEFAKLPDKKTLCYVVDNR